MMMFQREKGPSAAGAPWLFRANFRPVPLPQLFRCPHLHAVNTTIAAHVRLHRSHVRRAHSSSAAAPLGRGP